MAQSHSRPPPEDAGDVIKDIYDQKVESGLRGMFSPIKQVGMGGFGRAVVTTALAIVAVTALITGYMALGGQLSVGGIPVDTLEQGIAQGMSKAVEFMISPMGLGTLAAGGAVGVVSNVVHNQQKISAQQTKMMALEYKNMQEHVKALEKEHAPQQQNEQIEKDTAQPQQDQHKHGPLNANSEKELQAAAKKPEHNNENKEAGFQAAELKRRSEATKPHEIGAS